MGKCNATRVGEGRGRINSPLSPPRSRYPPGTATLQSPLQVQLYDFNSLAAAVAVGVAAATIIERAPPQTSRPWSAATGFSASSPCRHLQDALRPE